MVKRKKYRQEHRLRYARLLTSVVGLLQTSVHCRRRKKKIRTTNSILIRVRTSPKYRSRTRFWKLCYSF